LTHILATESAQHWESLLREHRVPVSRIQRLEAVLADEHVRSRHVLHRFGVEADVLAGLTVPVSGFQLSRSPTGVTTPPQQVGAQNLALLSELGYGAQEIEAMRAKGVIS
jgi:crotonobetainyl-CoA:carnitine CoA-transferase CaiB-like acyl-CoA transferase